jgi:hypothetical protein
MRRGTTPTYVLDLSKIPAERVKDICLAFTQTKSGHSLFLHMDEGRITVNGNLGYATLTQEETNAFAKGKAKRQVKIKYEDNVVRSTDIETEDVYDVLHEEVL